MRQKSRFSAKKIHEKKLLHKCVNFSRWEVRKTFSFMTKIVCPKIAFLPCFFHGKRSSRECTNFDAFFASKIALFCTKILTVSDSKLAFQVPNSPKNSFQGTICIGCASDLVTMRSCKLANARLLLAEPGRAGGKLNQCYR